VPPADTWPDMSGPNEVGSSTISHDALCVFLATPAVGMTLHTTGSFFRLSTLSKVLLSGRLGTERERHLYHTRFLASQLEKTGDQKSLAIAGLSCVTSCEGYARSE
jgi:hypothetical protein